MTAVLTAVLIAVALIVALGLLSRLTGFRSQKIAEFQGKGPAFDPRRHLSGPILCEGIIYGPFGRVSSRFVARMEGRWSGTQCVLTEAFRYDSGEVQNREWQLTLGNDGALQAVAEDLVGTGRGTICGPAVRMRYRLRLPTGAGGHVLDVEDWMYLAPNGTIMNRSQFRKFGIKVAELIATMRPEAEMQVSRQEAAQ